MASEESTQGQHFVECDLCQKPVSFFCRRCGVNLCDSCIPVHLRLKSKTGHDVVHFTSREDENTCLCESHPLNVKQWAFHHVRLALQLIPRLSSLSNTCLVDQHARYIRRGVNSHPVPAGPPETVRLRTTRDARIFFPSQTGLSGPS